MIEVSIPNRLLTDPTVFKTVPGAVQDNHPKFGAGGEIRTLVSRMATANNYQAILRTQNRKHVSRRSRCPNTQGVRYPMPGEGKTGPLGQ